MKYLLIPTGVALAAILPLPIEAYHLVRWIVAGVCAFGAYEIFQSKNTEKVKGVILLVIVFVFNPLIPLYLTRGTWIIIDIVVAGLLFWLSAKPKSFERDGGKIANVTLKATKKVEKIEEKLLTVPIMPFEDGVGGVQLAVNTTTYPANTPLGGDALSRYVVPGLLLCAVIVALVIGISIGGEGKSPSPVYVPEPANATNAHIPKPVEPTFANAVEQLFGMAAVADSVKTGANEQTSFFVDVPFGSSEQVFRAVFLQTQTLESATGVVESCHVCAPSISAVVYQKKGDTWSIFSVSKFFTDFGSWGEATISSPVEILYDLAPRTVAFLIDAGWYGQGYLTSGKAIFALSDDGFRSLGYITLSENNAGACDDTIELFNKCWENFGSYAVERDPNGSFSTIRVTRTGTERGKDGNIIPVTNWIYRVTETKIYEREPS